MNFCFAEMIFCYGRVILRYGRMILCYAGMILYYDSIIVQEKGKNFAVAEISVLDLASQVRNVS
jgi:hypothetical protein